MKYIWTMVLAGALVSMMCACDDRDDHFLDQGSSEVKDMTVGEYIASKGDYAFFADFLKRTGYMDSVSGSRPVTVMLPPKEAITAWDESEMPVDSLLKYHIGGTLLYDFYFNVDDETGKFIRRNLKSLYKNKEIWVDKDHGGLLFDLEARSKTEPLICQNGIIYFLDKNLEPLENIFEGFEKPVEGYDMFREFVLKDSLLFKRELSDMIGVNEFGMPVYDSVFVDDYVYLVKYGRIDDEARRFEALRLSDEAYKKAYDNLVKRYYTSEENLPDYFTDDVEYRKWLHDKIMASTLFYKSFEELEQGDTVSTSGGDIILTEEWFAEEPTRFSNGYVHDIANLELLMGPVMVRPLAFDASDDSKLMYYGFDNPMSDAPVIPSSGETPDDGSQFEEVERSVSVKDQQVAFNFSADKKFYVQYRLEDVPAGMFDVSISGLKDNSTGAKVYLDGEVLDTDYLPGYNWSYDVYREIMFSEFGDRTILFEVDTPDDDGKYKISLNYFTMSARWE
ncbi:hypothetical protein FUAX_39460 (plasmid) [Fulvitalea axinellae]|uniref:FAS1 domain-containing protein n=1 Tax=Fulvitalea axinellae TaxID=1182444 RepID=A0AAU9CYD2_9BACT|nr:hypothetical protein FUAX_39460 [Fulvitalea axinellae]